MDGMKLENAVAVAITGSGKSKIIVKWCIDKFIPEGIVNFKLIHIYPKITSVPTPMGNSLPISKVRDDVAAAYKKEIEWHRSEKLLPYKKMLSHRKVLVDFVVIESDDVANAISKEVANCNIIKLVIGTSSSSMFSRKAKELSSQISVCAPKFCTVYAVSKGKLASIRPSVLENSISPTFLEKKECIKDDASETGSSPNSSSSYSSSLQTEYTDGGSVSSISLFSSSLPFQRFQALSNINQTLLNKKVSSIEGNHSRSQSLEIEKKKPHTSDTSWRSLTEDRVSHSGESSTSEALLNYGHSSSESQQDVEFELEKLRVELRHAQGMYAVAKNETIGASQKLNDLYKRRIEEAKKLGEIETKEENAKELARQEKQKLEATIKEATYMRERAEREAYLKRDADIRAMRDAKEKEKLEHALLGSFQQYRNYSWEEIESATSSFSEDLKIGCGAYGTVYKCSLHHTTAAVKVLHSPDCSKNKQFLQELEILSKIRHPHLLILLGACEDRGCLVYEYMENGSLEDRLFCKNRTPPIPWYERFRIAWEVASVLVFLHSSKPEPIIHRDLKPANILLDHNLVSKIGDVGLSTILNSDRSHSTANKESGLVGTFCYIDPEYQRTGLVSPLSDVYAFGMVVLQLLTAKPAIGLAHKVDTAINDSHLAEILDPKAGKWPVEETMQLAELGISCVELRRKDRPDLKDRVLPALERLKDIAYMAQVSVSVIPSLAPSHFICPIRKDVMNDPCVAADGYTYDRRAIEKWLQENDKSPMTNLPLPSKNLLPNYTLLSAIMEWNSRKN